MTCSMAAYCCRRVGEVGLGGVRQAASSDDLLRQRLHGRGGARDDGHPRAFSREAPGGSGRDTGGPGDDDPASGESVHGGATSGWW